MKTAWRKFYEEERREMGDLRSETGIRNQEPGAKILDNINNKL